MFLSDVIYTTNWVVTRCQRIMPIVRLNGSSWNFGFHIINRARSEEHFPKHVTYLPTGYGTYFVNSA